MYIKHSNSDPLFVLNLTKALCVTVIVSLSFLYMIGKRTLKPYKSKRNNLEFQPPTGFAEAVGSSLYLEKCLCMVALVPFTLHRFFSTTVSDDNQIKHR